MLLFRLGITEAVTDTYVWAGGLANKLWAAAGVKLNIMMARVWNWYVDLGTRFDNRGAPSRLLYLFVKDQAEWAMQKADVSWGFAVAATTTATTHHCDYCRRHHHHHHQPQSPRYRNHHTLP